MKAVNLLLVPVKLFITFGLSSSFAFLLARSWQADWIGGMVFGLTGCVCFLYWFEKEMKKSPYAARMLSGCMAGLFTGAVLVSAHEHDRFDLGVFLMGCAVFWIWRCWEICNQIKELEKKQKNEPKNIVF